MFAEQIYDVAEKVPIDAWLKACRSALRTLPPPPEGQDTWYVVMFFILRVYS